MLKRIPLFCQETGYSEKAVARKIEDDVWVEGREYVRAPDGRLLIDTEGYEAWARCGVRLIHGAQTVTKPADDGWVEWNGGNRPVAAHCEVEIVCREGGVNVACAYHFEWTHTGHSTDIVRYRVCA